MTEHAPAPPQMPTAEIVRLDRRRAERRRGGPPEAYTPEVLELLRLCGAELRAADGGAVAAAAVDRRDAGAHTPER